MTASTSAGDKLRSLIIHTFLTAAEAVARRLRDTGLPLAVQVDRSVVTPGKAVGEWGISASKASVNVLRIHQVAAQIAPWLSAAELTEVDRCAAQLAESASGTLPFWAVFSGRPLPVFTAAQNITEVPPPKYQETPGGWVARFVLLPALQYHLTAMPTVTDEAEDSASDFADEVLHVAHDSQLHYTLIVPLNGLALYPPEAVLSTEQVRVRVASDAERGEWLDQRGGMSQAFLQGGDIAFPEIVIEVAVSTERNVAFTAEPEHVASLIGALQLHGCWVAGRLYRVQSKPAWIFPVQQHLPLTVPGIVSGRSALTAERFAAAAATATALADYGLAVPRSPQDLALHRFLAGVAREGISNFLPGGANRNATDAVLDFAIALEALLLPYDENARHGDLSYRFRMHGAHYLADGATERRQVMRQLSNIYEVRSRLVHGARYPSPDELRAARDTARELARRGLLRAIDEGFPTAAKFNQMILGVD